MPATRRFQPAWDVNQRWAPMNARLPSDVVAVALFNVHLLVSSVLFRRFVVVSRRAVLFARLF